MVDNPFIPRNINNALIYHEENSYHPQTSFNNHNIELVDSNEKPTQVIPVNNLYSNAQVLNAPQQLSTMDIVGNNRHANVYPYPHAHASTLHNHYDHTHHQTQSELVDLIQQTIRREMTGQQYQST